MKPYFTKWIPVEGEIKEGDMYLFGNSFFKAGNDKDYGRGLKKVKLFLCSRDIQVGDIVVINWENGDSTEDEVMGISSKEMYQLKNDNWCYKEFAELKEPKTIGEISPDATWVKEGMEFGEDQVKFDRRLMTFTDEGNPILGGEIYRARIKGPCGHFH